MSVDRTQALVLTYSLGLFGLVKPSEHCLLERKTNMPDKHMVTTLEPGLAATRNTDVWAVARKAAGITMNVAHLQKTSTEKGIRKGRSMWARA